MKKYIFYLFFWFVIPIQAQWIQQNSGTTENLNDVYCISADTVVVVGNNATILRTTDGGTNWLPVSNPASVNLHQVAFANNQTGYAVGDNGTLLKTTDAGMSWQSLTTNTTENLLTLSIVSADTIYTGGTNGLIMKTVDGGNNWSNLNSGITQNIIDIQFVNSNVGYAVPQLNNCETQNAMLIKSVDGGINWTIVNINISAISKINCIDENNVYVQTCNPIGEIYVTDDAFVNVYFVFNSEEGKIENFYVIDNFKIWIVGWDSRTYGNNDAYNALFEFTNGQTNPSITYFNGGDPPPYKGIDFANPTTGYIVGALGVIRKNTTGNNVSAINEFENKIIKIIPNPSSGKIIIQNKNSQIKLVSYSIINLQGKKVVTEKELTGNTINATQLSNGTYMIRLRDNDNNYYAHKLIIKK